MPLIQWMNVRQRLHVGFGMVENHQNVCGEGSHEVLDGTEHVTKAKQKAKNETRGVINSLNFKLYEQVC